MSYEHLMFERHGHVALVTLNRPDRLNALNGGLREDIRNACAEVENDDDLRVMVLTGAGRGFCAGMDLSEPRDSDEEIAPQNERLDDLGWVGRQAISVYRMTKPTIAAMNGVAAGAGMSLALACDMRVGSDQSRFKTVFVERAQPPDAGLTYFLPRVIGYSRAVDLIFTSRSVDADEAYRLGVLDRMVEHDRLVEESIELADSIAKWPPLAIRSAKRVIQRNLLTDLEDSVRNEIRGIEFARRAPNDYAESRASFFEKREPNFTGT